MVRSAVILCGGQQTRLRSLGYPKHLIRVAGETLLARSVRLLRDRHVSDIVVVAEPEALSAECQRLGVVEYAREEAPMLLAAERAIVEHAFSEALVLLGDVCWSRHLLNLWIDECALHGPLAVRRTGPSQMTGKPYSEHFGIYCSRYDLRRLDARRFYCLADAVSTNVFGLERTLEQPSSDWTEDFDTPADVAELTPLLERYCAAERMAVAS